MRRFLTVIRRNPPIVNYSGFVVVNREMITSVSSQDLKFVAVMWLQAHYGVERVTFLICVSGTLRNVDVTVIEQRFRGPQLTKNCGDYIKPHV